MINTLPEAIAIVGVCFSIVFGIVSVIKILYGHSFCPSHSELLKTVKRLEPLIAKIVVTFSDIASIKQQLIILTVDITEETPEGIAKREKVIAAMMKNREKNF